MASALIKAIRSVTGQQPAHRRLIEKASQTFLAGVPVSVEVASGGVVEWDGTTIAGLIAGVSKEGGSSLTTIAVPKTLSYGSVPNQPLAVKIPAGAPLNDGRCGVDIADQNTVFHGQLKSDQTFAVTDVGLSYGMTKDTDNHWYVDKTKTTTSGGGGASQAVVKIVKGDSFDTRGVQFQFLAAACQGIV